VTPNTVLDAQASGAVFQQKTFLALGLGAFSTIPQ
jgi:hypothetical protein